MRAPEILAPAGDAAALGAALAAGADAVYLGIDEGLNARARAANFPLAELGATCDRVHRAGARLYLTMNTLVFEHELPFVEIVLRRAAEAGVDALIVQDPAVALLARAVAPTLEVHASTQMTISSPEAAVLAAGLGVTRVVVPRELSVAEIRKFKAGTPLELEVFVHGALCMSWSGQCLTSEAWGGRSANRGQCAQSCRLPYDLVVDGVVRPLGDVRYLLSPLDLAGVRAIPELAEIGVASLKIEGRMKGPGYVTTAVEGYRRWRDAIAAGRADEAHDQLRADLGRMAVAYSRGFSDGFLAGSDHQDLVEGRFPKHRGALLGVVADVTGNGVRVVRADRAATGGVALRDGAGPDGVVSSPLPPIGGGSALDARGVPLAPPELVPGMGIGFDRGDPEHAEPGGPLFAAEPTPDGWWLRFGRPGPDLSQVRPGHRAWLTGDARLDRVGADPDQRIRVAVTVTGRGGEPLQVRMDAGRARVEGSTRPLEAATGAGLTAATLHEKLLALGGTPFRADPVTIDVDEGLFVPVSELKALRRTLVDALTDAVLAAHRHATDARPAATRVVAEAARRVADAAGPHARRPYVPPERPVVVPLCRTDAQLDAVIALGLPEVELDWMERVGLALAVRRARDAGLKVTVATVRVQKPGEQAYDEHVARMRPDAVLVRHWGGLVHFAGLPDGDRPVVHGDFSLNVTNSVTAHHLLALGADTLTAAHDLDERQLHALLDAVPADRLTVVAHHHIATFHTEHCVYAHTLSHGRDYRTCGRPCEQHRVALRDPIGLEHPVVVDVGCRNTVFNAAAQSAANVVPGLVRRGVRRFRVEFVWEGADEARAVLVAWQALLSGRLDAPELIRRIRAHEQFGVTSGTMRTMA